MPFLMEPAFEGVSIGSPAWFELQQRVIQSRPLLKAAYDEWYGRLLGDAASVRAPGVVVELGSGGGYVKQLDPSVITSDVVPGVADRVIDGRELPFADGSVKAIFLTHAFHHIPDVTRFLAEAQRVLVPGGVISMVEVAHTPFAKFFFSRFHPEPYRDDVREWDFAQNHAMGDANQALSWVVFFRDRARLERDFPALQLERAELLPFLSYLLSGGVTRRNLIPSFALGGVRLLDRLSRATLPATALHWHLTVRKKATP